MSKKITVKQDDATTTQETQDAAKRIALLDVEAYTSQIAKLQTTREFDIASNTRTAIINRVLVASFLAEKRLRASEIAFLAQTQATHSHLRTLTVVRSTREILEQDAAKTYRLTQYACTLLRLDYDNASDEKKTTTKKTTKKKVVVAK